MFLQVNENITMEGEYTMKVYKPDGTLSKEVGPFKNLITDAGINSYGITSGVGSFNIQYCFVGTGTTPPTVSDTTMGAYVGVSNGTLSDTSTSGGAPDYYVQLSTVKRFNPGSATGNLTEVGMGELVSTTGPVYSLLFSRALIVDSSGNPLTITVLPDEYLDVTYTLRYYVSNSDSTVSVTDTGTGISHTLTSRRYSAATANANTTGNIFPLGNGDTLTCMGRSSAGVAPSLAPITSSTALLNSSGLGGSGVSFSYPGYVGNSYNRSVVATISLDTGNGTYGIEGFDVRSAGALGLRTQVRVSPAIMKTNSKTLTVGFNVSWARRP